MGRALDRALLAEGRSVTGTTAGLTRSIDHRRLNWDRLDLGQPDERWKQIGRGADVIYHLACSSVPSEASRAPLEDARVNIIGSLSLIRAVQEAQPQADTRRLTNSRQPLPVPGQQIARSMPILQNDHIHVEIVTRGAELFRLQDCRGTDFLWDGDPAWWSGRAPILFPIVGKAPRDTVVVDGREYRMRQHGFARTSEFTVTRADETECCLRLEASGETRAQYPFNFILDIRHAIVGPSLLTEAIVRNVDDRPMPVSFGFHPALMWPLADAGPRGGHILVFADREPAPVRRLQDGLLGRERHPSPVVDGRLE